MARRSAADAALTREQILAAARKLFAANGYAATTTGEIADEAGVTVGALFHHFDGKSGLFRSVVESLEIEMDAHLRTVVSERRGLEAFLDGFRAWLEFARRQDWHRIVMIEGPVVLGEKEFHSVEARRGAAILMEGLESLVEEGIIEDRPRAPLGMLLLGAAAEAGYQIARGGSRKDIDGYVDAMRYLLTPHLRAAAKRLQSAKAAVAAATSPKRRRT
jgi:AcrR family transcriptional regulator